MKVTLDNIKAYIKTKSEASLAIEGMWVARSGMGIQIHNKTQAIFGFSASFNRSECETSSTYELLENLAFLPSVYNDKNANKCVMNVVGELDYIKGEKKIHDFLNGSPGPKGLFYSNGCAISPDMQSAITHSRYELFERHLCCEIWYQRAHLLQELECSINIYKKDIKINVYTINFLDNIDFCGKFAIASLDFPQINFFALGAAIRSNLQAALNHAVSEAIIVFEDAVRGKRGVSTEPMQRDILSLRERGISQKRRKYFKKLLCRKSLNASPIVPILQTIIFEPFPKLYAARTFSYNALEPKQFKEITHLPIMPLF